jgi:hypothetical protein
MPSLNRVIKDHPEYQYPLYYKVKLMMISGSSQEVLSTFIPFAKRKQNDFWVWDLMADLFPEEEDLQFACYCKALSLKAPEEYVGKIRIKLTRLLLRKGKFAEAKTELAALLAAYTAQKWKTPAQVTSWIGESWYAEATARPNNKKLYAQNAEKAEEVLYLDVPEETILVEFVNKNKHMIHFVHDKSRHGFFKYAGLVDKPKVGDLLSVRLRGNEKTGFQKLLTAKSADPTAKIPAIRPFNGSVKVIAPVNFGFADDVFLPPEMIKAANLSDGIICGGTAGLSYNKNKESWGWKAITIVQN